MGGTEKPVDLSRRRLLQGSLGGAAFLQLGALLPTACASYPPRNDGAFTALDAKTAAIVEAVADAMVDDGTGKLPIPSKLGIARRVDRMVAGLHPDVRTQTLLMFNVIEHFPLVFGFYTARFTKLPRADQKAYLEGWESSGLGFRRMIAQALKMFVYVNYYAAPETWEMLGYDGPWVGRFDIPPTEPPLAKYTEKEPL